VTGNKLFQSIVQNKNKLYFASLESRASKMKSIFCCLVFCLVLSVSARRELRQETTTSTSVAFSSTPGTAAVATASASSSSSSSSDESESDEAREFNDQIDVYFLVDLTIKVPGALDALQQFAEGIVEEIFGIAPSVRIGVGSYSDVETTFEFRKEVNLTDDQDDVVDALVGLEFLVGSVGLESQLFALESVATDDEVGFRPESLKIIIWIGDSPAFEPLAEASEVATTDALVELGARVIAIDIGNLDSTGEASRIVGATDGIFFKANDEGLFETVAVTVTSDDGSSEASSSASGDVTFVSSSAGSNTATVIGSLGLPDAILEGVLTIVEAEAET